MSGVQSKTATEADMNPGFCGNEVTWSQSDGATDEWGHQVRHVHAEWVRAASRTIAAIRRLHVMDGDGFIPVCRECGKPYPCASVAAMGGLR